MKRMAVSTILSVLALAAVWSPGAGAEQPGAPAIGSAAWYTAGEMPGIM